MFAERDFDSQDNTAIRREVTLGERELLNQSIPCLDARCEPS